MQNMLVRNLALMMTLAALLPVKLAGAQGPPPVTPVAPAPVAKIASAGTFTDKTGSKHAWQVSAEHTLLWEGESYLPVGGTFAPRSFLNASDAAWEEDKKALDGLKARDMRDLILWPEKSLYSIPVASIQRLLDYLDTNEFRYGLAFGPGLTTPLSGYVVRPAYYRHEDRDSLSATWNVGSDADAGLFTLVDISNENRLIKGGIINAREGVISAPTEPPAGAGRVVSNLYPHKLLPASGNGTLPDVWRGYDDYRDQLLRTLSAVKFGKGLRFFLDPLARHLGLNGEADFLVPDSDAFRLEFESFLQRNYPNVEELKQAWGVTEGDFRTHQQLSRLMPLWANERGIPYFYDVVSNKTYRILDTRQSRWWQDYLASRNESVRYVMNALATTLKRHIAEVPVVYTWTQPHPIFLNAATEDGYDGLGIAVRSSGSVLLSRTLGPAFSQAEQSGRTVWCIATQVTGELNAVANNPAGTPTEASQNGPAPPKQSSGGYNSKAELFTTLDGLRKMGVKGFYGDSFQANPTDRQSGVAEWLSTPDRLDWLKEYGQRVEREPNAGKYAPSVLFFPQSAPGPARVGLVPGTTNVFWLNSFASGEVLDWWPSYSGYVLRNNNGSSETVLVSLQGPRKTHLVVPDAKQVKAYTPDNVEVPLRIQGKNVVEVTLDTTPMIFRASGQRLVPKEAAEDVMLQLGALLQQALAQKLPAVDADRAALDRSAADYKRGDFESSYTFARSSLDGLTYTVAPYIWMEGEYPYQKAHSFNEIAPHVEASGGAYLRLSTPNPPARTGYGARYVFDVPMDGTYTIWIAGTVPGPNTSPIHWRMNTEPEREVANPSPQGPLYLSERFGWFQLGTVTLQKGPQQSLSLYVTDKAASPPEYIFSVDAILITRTAFAPNGPVRPVPVDAYTLRNYQKNKKDK